MKHLAILLMLAAATAAGSRVQAQPLVNTHWKIYVADAVNDTITLHIKTDSSYVTMSTGSVVVRSVVRMMKDTIAITDYEGQFACPDMTGKYRVTVTGDELSFTLVEDPCEGRAAAITAGKWKRAAAPVAVK